MNKTYFGGTTKPFADSVPVTYFRRWGFSINEGGGPVNVHMQWNQPTFWLFFYIYVLGARWSFRIKRKAPR